VSNGEVNAATTVTGPLGRYLAAATTSRLADEALSLAVVLFLLAEGQGAIVAGACVMTVNILGIVSGPFIGHRLDRVRRRKLFMLANPVAVIVSLSALAMLTGHVAGAVLPLLLVPAGLTNPLNTGGFTSLIPLIVPTENMAAANALEAASYSSAGILGPAIAGLAVALGGARASIWIIAGIAAVAIPLIAITPTPDDERLGSSLAETAREFLRDRRLTAITFATTLAICGQGLLVVALPRYAQLLGTRAAVGGYLFALFGISSAVGAVAFARPSAAQPLRCASIGLIWLGLLMAGWAVAPSLAVALVLVFLAGFADGPVISAMFSGRQRWARPSHYARITTMAASIRTAVFAVGSLLGGVLVAGVGVRTTLAVAAAIQLLAALSIPAFGWMRAATGRLASDES
jgi:predicted MFS family arabinose efflux permease